jgi:hypothetical protein
MIKVLGENIKRRKTASKKNNSGISPSFQQKKNFWLKDPDPTPFFSDFKDAKKILIFFSYNLRYPQAHYFFFFNTIRCKNFIFQALFQSA